MFERVGIFNLGVARGGGGIGVSEVEVIEKGGEIKLMIV